MRIRTSVRPIFTAGILLLAATVACSVNSTGTDADTGSDQGPVVSGKGGIAGRIWHDHCATPDQGVPTPSIPPEGCVTSDESGVLRGNGRLDQGEESIPGVELSLGEGACPSFGLATTVTGADGIYLFAGLEPGTYCVMVDPNNGANASRLLPGRWTYPQVSDDIGAISQEVTIEEGELRSDVSFAWDFQFAPEYIPPTEPSPLPSLTPSPSATETPSGTATPTATPTLTPTATLGANDPRSSLSSPTWHEDFADSSDWGLYSDVHVRFELGDHELLMTAFNPNFYNGWLLSWRRDDNFYLEATVEVGACSGRDAFGLMFRAPNASNGYLYGISCSGEYVLRTWNGEKMSNLVVWTSNSAIPSGPDSTRRIGVWASGDELSLYVDGQFLRQITDSTYTNGLFGLFISSASTPDFTVRVTAVDYWDLP